MSKKVWKYFHEGDKFQEAIVFVVDELCKHTRPDIVAFLERKELYELKERIKITIEIYDENE